MRAPFWSLLVAVVWLVALQRVPAAAAQQRPPGEISGERSAEQRAQAQPASSPAKPGGAQKEDKKEEPQGLQYRLVGPFRGGRSLTASGIPGNARVYYFGGTGGGVWKSDDGAATWKSVFDKEGTSSIGSLAVAESDPNIVYAGTGEACIRGNISHGDGVYKSTDAGKTWKNIGLTDTRAIGKLIVHPRDPNTVFVAALGHVYGPNTERGVFRTTDGGKTWEKVLYKDQNTGAVDIAFDPGNPSILFASLWQAYRTPWSLSSGGPGSGLYKSSDGGSTWKSVEGSGLPQKPWGRIGVSVAAKSDRVYALIEAKDGGLYRSDDGGSKWELINPDHRYTQRAWYYMHVFADPRDADTLYIMNVDFHRSTDGGRTFNKIKVPHGDNHGLWIDPQDTKRMIATNDGGATVTLDGGKTWSTQYNQPTAQFYHVITDNRFPYYIYGAQQDNSTVGIASRDFEHGIDRADWYDVGGGESGYIAPYPPDPDIVYAGEYQGQLTRFNRKTSERKEISPMPMLSDAVGASGLPHRFQWTAPLFISPHDPNLLYLGGESLFVTTDQGMHWQTISPDLTRNDKSKQQPSGGPITIDDTGTEYYDVIFAAAESPLSKGLVWAGTDDGLVQLTRDGGQHWQNVTPRDLPPWSRVSLIDASPHEAGKAYVAVDRHQNDDLRPYIFKTSDYGKTWTKITNGIPPTTFVRAVREDPKRKGLLFAGTETGVFVSYDDGAGWQSLQLNLPTTPVHDLVVHGDDLVLATHGRAFWVLDDIGPLRQHAGNIEQQPFHLFAPSTALRVRGPGRFGRMQIAGENPPAGAIVYFNLKSLPKQAQLEILDAQGNLVRRVSSQQTEPVDEPPDPEDEKPKPELQLKAGMNRYVWDMRYNQVPRLPNYYLYEYQSGTEGAMAMPGRYTVRLTVDGQTQSAPLDLQMNPLVKTPVADLQKQFDLVRQIQAELVRLNQAVAQIWDLRSQTRDLAKRLSQDTRAPRVLLASTETLDRKMADIEDRMVQMKISANEDSLRYPPGLDAKLAYLAESVGGSNDQAPTAAHYQQFEQLKQQADEVVARWTSLLNTELPAFQQQMQQANIRTLIVSQPLGQETRGGGEK
jgi:photosystem II stability/assembly factor-like uncharacterized protein